MILINKLEKKNKEPDIKECEKELLVQELKEAKIALDAAYSVLQNVTEPDLIDSAIYQLKSVQMKYSFLHKKYLEYV